jgi:hypothetical protein
MAYDRALLACGARDARAAHQALALLRSALSAGDTDYGTFDSLFMWCDCAVAARDFTGAAHWLAALRSSWSKAVITGDAPAATREASSFVQGIDNNT